MRPLIALVGIVFSSGLLINNLQAQTSSPAPTGSVVAPAAAAPSSTFSFSPSVWFGLRTNLVGITANGSKDMNTAGGFIKPGISFKWNNSPLLVNAKYTFETSAAKGFGNETAFQSAGNTKSVANNTYYQHEPIIFISGQANESWKMNAFFDLWINQENKRAQNTFYELTVQPDLEYKLSSALSVAVGYQLFRKNYFDTTVVGDFSTGAAAASTQKPKAGSFKATSADVVGQNPLTTLNAGIVTATIKPTDTITIVSYFRAGRQSSTIAGRDGMNYRFNADVSTKLSDRWNVQLRYRYHLEDNNRTATYFYNRGRAIVSYAFNKSWSADVQNQFTLEQTNAPTSRAKYTNENYAGLNYKF